MRYKNKPLLSTFGKEGGGYVSLHANNPIKYTDPDGRDFGVNEFEPEPPGGENPPEVPDCPECDPSVPLMQEVLITTTRFIGPQSAEEIVFYLDAIKQVRAKEKEISDNNPVIIYQNCHLLIVQITNDLNNEKRNPIKLRPLRSST